MVVGVACRGYVLRGPRGTFAPTNGVDPGPSPSRYLVELLLVLPLDRLPLAEDLGVGRDDAVLCGVGLNDLELDTAHATAGEEGVALEGGGGRARGATKEISTMINLTVLFYEVCQFFLRNRQT